MSPKSQIPELSQAARLKLSNIPKRPVARHACLSCREKKIKCDGEVRLDTGEGPNGDYKHEICTNCKNLGIECVFVRSQRGGKRKLKGSSNKSVESANTGFLQPNNTLSYITKSPTLASPNSNKTSSSNSPLLSATESSKNNTDALQEKMRQLQREAASIQSQLESSTSGSLYSNSSSTNDFMNHGRRDSLLHPHLNDLGAYGTGPGDWYGQYPQGPPPFARKHHHHHQHPHQHPHEHHSHRHQHTRPMHASHGYSEPPPPPPIDFHGNHQSGRFPASNLHHEPQRYGPYNNLHPSMYPLNQGPNGPPPPPGFERESYGHKRKISPEPKEYLPKVSKPANFIKISDEELETFDLPNWKTTCILIDLYYRYVYPSRPFLAPKHRFIYQLQIRQDASLLHAMFSTSCRYASNTLFTNPNLLDPDHWYFLAEKYWDFLDVESSLQALVLLMGSLGPCGFVQQAIEGEERVFRLFKSQNTIERLKINNWKEFADVTTKRQILRNEDVLRTLWGSWKLNVFIRINRGFPFHKVSDKFISFMPDLAFPHSDSTFNMNLSLFDSNDSRSISNLNHQTWSEVQRDLHNASLDKATYAKFTDATLVIVSVKYMEDLMDAISSGSLNLTTVNEFNSKITLLEQITNSSLYQISHIKKKIVILNISKIFSLFLLAIGKLLINASQCSDILLVKPHRTNATASPDHVFNPLYETDLKEILQNCLNSTTEKLKHFIITFNTAIDIVSLIEYGLGKIKENSNSLVPLTVIGGPLNFTPASEISSLRSHENWWTESSQNMDSQAQTYSEFPDVWLQYPIFSVVIIANALTVLSSAIILKQMFNVTFDQNEKGENIAKFTVINNDKSVEVAVDTESFEKLKKHFDTVELDAKVRLCARYVQAHGRFWPYVQSASHEIESLMNYIDEILHTKFRPY